MEMLTIHSQKTRVLYPFFFDADKFKEVVDALEAFKIPIELRQKNTTGKKDHYLNVWQAAHEKSLDKEYLASGKISKKEYEEEKVKKIHKLYSLGMLKTPKNFLFNLDKKVYWKVPHQIINKWFKNAVELDFDGNNISKITCSGNEAIELFLSEYGVGVLSISFTLKNPSSRDQLKQLNYRLSQSGQFKKASTLKLPLPDTKNKKIHSTIKKLPKPPASNALLSERLGKIGGSFNLCELFDYLLQPLTVANLDTLKFKLYTVVRLSQTQDTNIVNFGDQCLSEYWQPILYGLTNIEENNHPGIFSTENQLLNPNHWAAIGSLGCATLFIDQYYPAQKFDETRVDNIFNKYFANYLLVLFQDLILQNFLNQAAEIASKAECSYKTCDVEDNESNWTQDIKAIHLAHLRFSASGYFIETNIRDTVNQFYCLVQKGLHVPENFRLTQRVFHDIEVSAEMQQQQDFQKHMKDVVERLDQNVNAVKDVQNEVKDLAKQLNQNVNVVKNVQSKVEWLEVFFASYYAGALAYYIAKSAKFNCPIEALFGLSFQAVSVAGWALFAGLLVFFIAEPHKIEEHAQAPHKHSSKKNWALLFISILFIIGIWFSLGLQGFKGCKPSTESVTSYIEVIDETENNS